MSENFSIILVDDHELYRVGIRSAIRQANKGIFKFKIIAEVASGNDFFDIINNGVIPNIVMLDIVLPDTNGIEIARQLREINKDIKILMLSSEVTFDLVSELLEIGVDGYLSKLAQPIDIAIALNNIAAGNCFFGKSVSELMSDVYVEKSSNRNKIKKFFSIKNKTTNFDLTEREMEITKMWCDGNTAREIADNLDISIRTVETHKANILDKLGFDKYASLIKYAIKKGIIKI